MTSPGFFAFLVRVWLCRRSSWPCQTRWLHLVSAPFGDPFLRGRQSDAVVAQLVRAPVCGTGGRWFEPTQLYQTLPSDVPDHTTGSRAGAPAASPCGVIFLAAEVQCPLATYSSHEARYRSFAQGGVLDEQF